MAVRDAIAEHPREKIMKTDNNSDKKVFLLAQELKLARVLAGNNKTSRDKALKSLKKWFANRSKTLPFTDNDFQIIWKGLYYSMWMSDKPLVQEECAESISSLIHFETIEESLLFFKAGLTILINEWFGIDQLRLDKFLMLVRRLLRQMLKALKHHSLSKDNVEKFGEIIYFTILNTDIHPPVGLFMHFTEIYLEEIAKITKGNMPSERVVDFIKPFIKKLVKTSDGREIAHIKKFIFQYLMKQSDSGIEYEIKYSAWKKAGFPGTIDSMQKIKLDAEETGPVGKNSRHIRGGPLDPRAGRVHVDLPQIRFKAKDILKALLEFKFSKDSNSKSRRSIAELIEQFTKMSKGVYPLGTKKVYDSEKDSYDTSIRKAVNRLVKFDKKLMSQSQKKRNRSDGNEEVEEVPTKVRKIDSANETAPPKLKKSKISKAEDIIDEDFSDNNEVTEEELQQFIAQSEGNVPKKLKKKKKNPEKQKSDEVDDAQETDNVQKDVSENKQKKKRKDKIGQKKVARRKGKPQDIINNIECVFERNSGTWVVFDLREDTEQVETPSLNAEAEVSVIIDDKENPSIASRNPENTESVLGLVKSPSTLGTDLGSSSNGDEVPSINKGSPSKSPISEQGSPKSGLSPVRLFESQEQKDLFPKSSWDEPLQEGEYEICIPSKKHVAKLKRQAKKNKQDLHAVINTSMKRIRGKGRLSLSADMVKKVFSSTPSSGKKVKINTRLNQSQEIHEHVQQILSSPAIPYDANKKPLKPLLKTTGSLTPINPFYNKQLKIW